MIIVWEVIRQNGREGNCRSSERKKSSPLELYIGNDNMEMHLFFSVVSLSAFVVAELVPMAAVSQVWEQRWRFV